MIRAQQESMEPPTFRINKKIPRGPPSPPAPILHSPSRKVTVKEQKEWKISPCESNWNNAKGYTIPLEQVHINEKFANLFIADRKAREADEARAQMEKKLAQKEKEKMEDILRMMAQCAHEERAGLRNPEDAPLDTNKDACDDLRAERHRERQNDRNLARATPEKRTKLQREHERDISEQIAFGLPVKSIGNGETLFDQRLFNTTKGMNSVYADDAAYSMYDERNASTLDSHLYRPSKHNDIEAYDTDSDQIVNAQRFVPDKEFSGTSCNTNNVQRSGPIQFEKEEDPLGLDQF